MGQRLNFRTGLVLLTVAGALVVGACEPADEGFSNDRSGSDTFETDSGANNGGGNGGGLNSAGGGNSGNNGGGAGLSSGQENAVSSADEYLSMSGFSRSGLIEQLKFEGYSTKQATFAVDYLSANWNEQAARSADDYLSMSSFSRSGLIEQLEFEGYTREQAEYGANKTLGGVNSAGGGNTGNGGGGGLTSGQENAVRSAEEYLSMSGFSRSGLIEQLTFEGYSTKDATFAVERLRVDWNAQAARSADDYVSMSSFSRSGLIEQLEFEGYTREQAEFGADKAL